MQIVEAYTIVFLLMLADKSTCRNTHRRCSRGTNHQRRHCRELELNDPCETGTGHDSYLMLQREVPQTCDVMYYTNVQRTTIEGNFGFDQCAWQTGNKYSSTCPHHYVINHDENRRPKTLIEAKCNCDQNSPCLNGTDTSRCVPIKY